MPRVATLCVVCYSTTIFTRLELLLMFFRIFPCLAESIKRKRRKQPIIVHSLTVCAQVSALYTEYSLIFNKKVHGYRITRPLTVSVVMQAFRIFCIGLSKWACDLRGPGRQKQCRAGTEDGHSHRLYDLKVPLIKNHKITA